MLQLIDKTIQNYDKVLQSIKEDGFSFFVFGILQPRGKRTIYRYPFYADEETRVFISRKFNENLKDFCAQKNYRYLDVQSRFSDSSGLISKNFDFDSIHLNEKAGSIIAKEIRLRVSSKILSN